MGFRDCKDQGSSPGETLKSCLVWEVLCLKSGGLSFFVGRGYSQSWSHRGVLGKGASHKGAPGVFPRGDPNVPVADCVRRSPLGMFTFKE